MKPGIAVLVAIAVSATSSACGQEHGGEATPPSDDVLHAAASITPADYLRKISVIADDSMGGRNTPSPGLEVTAAWIAHEFERLGLTPGGDDGGYLQRYAIEAVHPDVAASSAKVSGGAELQFGRDLLSLGAFEGEVTGEAVVVTGSGGVSPETGAAVKGKHAIVMALPNGLDREGRRFVSNLLREGALSVLVATDKSDRDWSQEVRTLSGATSLRVGFGGGSRGPTLAVRDRAIGPILKAHGIDPDAARARPEVSVLEAPGLSLTVSPRVAVLENASAPNVVGILEGSDPELSDEYVVFSAHMDHIGIGTPNAQGDSINNGADDDASGTTAVLELAEAYAMLETRPARSLIFLTVSGEEKGLWGSEYFANHASVPMGQIVADLNADMVGRNWPDTIVAIGKEHSDLGTTLNQVNAAHPELNMTAIDDIWPDERFYFRSDHYNFARKGVPILFFFNGTHDDYHGRDDEVDRIDGEKASRITKLLFFLGYEVANRPQRPQWNPESRRQIVSDGS